MSYYGWSEPLVDDIPEASRPQPRNASLLWGENKHRAGFVCRSPSECKVLKICQRSSSLHWSPQYQPFLEGCRLLGVRAVLGHTPCKELATTLIERWRPETNTFHLVAGEATITLEDVEVLTGLPIREILLLYLWTSALSLIYASSGWASHRHLTLYRAGQLGFNG
ncbi:Serine/threonine-protein phosphatase 7 long form homolog [Linum perenne]